MGRRAVALAPGAGVNREFARAGRRDAERRRGRADPQDHRPGVQVLPGVCAAGPFGEPGQHLAVLKPADLDRAALEHRDVVGYLPVAAQRRASAPPDRGA